MGWVHWQDETRATDAILRAEFSRCEVKASAIVGSVWYAAIRPHGRDYTTALVVPFRRGGSGFGYKAMSEWEGPHAVRCPPSIVRMLSPVDELDAPARCRFWAQLWRARCLAESLGLPDAARRIADLAREARP